MSLVNSNPLILAAGGDYQISRSVRLRSSATGYFSRTFSGAPTNNKISTFSAWVKRGYLGSNVNHLFAGWDGSSSLAAGVWFQSDVLYCDFGGAAGSGRLITTQVFRDPSAWYHIVVQIDTTQATSSNRARIYVNGVQVTAFSTATYPALNAATLFAYQNANNRIGANWDNTTPLDGYLTEINFIDGQALTPSSFGETNPVTGVWQPKKYTGTYGTNGFFLTFQDNSAATATTIGKDYSGNGNNWTPNNISVTAGSTYDSMLDVPTIWGDGGNGRGNYATLNPLRYSTNGTLSEANLKYSNGSGDNGAKALSTIGIPSGKWYFEGQWISGPSNSRFVIGFASSTTSVTSASMPFERDGSQLGLTSSDIANVAIDFDAGKIWYGKNNVWISSGDPATGANPFQTFTPSSYDFLYPGLRLYSASDGTTVGVINFGQRPFSYTPPTGFKALNTGNLPEPTIANSSKYMDINLWTGDQSARTITNSGAMQPDFLWTKSRSNAEDHRLSDSVRGGNGTVLDTLASNTTGAQANDTDVTGFTSTGFNIRAGTNSPNVTGRTYVGWQWRASGTTVTNTSGSITSTVSASTTAGFSVVTYTGTGANATVGHGLGVAPRMIIFKRRSATANWAVYHASIGNTGALALDLTIATDTNIAYFNNTSPTSSVFTVGTGNSINASTSNYVAYAFAQIAGFSAFGSYTGNGSSAGPFVYLGFRPEFIMIKRTDTTGSWLIVDAARSPANTSVNGGMQNVLVPNTSGTEDTGADICDGVSNGFKFYQGAASFNANGGTYIYMAFAQNPFRYALAR